MTWTGLGWVGFTHWSVCGGEAGPIMSVFATCASFVDAYGEGS